MGNKRQLPQAAKLLPIFIVFCTTLRCHSLKYSQKINQQSELPSLIQQNGKETL